MDKIVVITGGTSGIGLDLKTLFEKNGDKVLTVSTRELEDENHYSCDVSNELKVKQVINEIGQKFGRIDLLINCAGFGMSGITELVPMEQIEKLTNVNYYGTLYAIRSAIRFMQTGSKIVIVSSAMALFPVPFRAIYGSIKSAVLNLSFSLRMELKPLGIDVVAFCPGDIKTNFTKNRIKEFETNERYGNRLQSATEKSDSREEKRIPSIKCTTEMYKKITKKKCKPFYIIGGKYRFLYFLTRITPKSWLLNITGKLYGGKFEEDTKKKKTNKATSIEEILPTESLDNIENSETTIENDTPIETQKTDETNLEEDTNENKEENRTNLLDLVEKMKHKDNEDSDNK